MVRTKAKKQKGDEAFQTRKQKVGRKKLAPATATRAEVHARTLRLSTSAAVSHAPTVPPSHVRGRDGSLGGPDDRKRSRKEEREEMKEAASMAQQSFAELLSGTRHYKSSHRASAFNAIARLLAAQEQREAKGRVAAGENRFAGFLAIPRAGTSKTVGAAHGGSRGPHERDVTPLERLKAYTAALEAITDTDDDARAAALSTLAAILRSGWISPQGAADPSTACAAASPGGAAVWAAPEEVYQEARLPHHAGGVFQASQITASTPRVSLDTHAGLSPVVPPEAAALERTKAALQSVHVAFTHALRGVRLAGVELLTLLLKYAQPGAVALAARAVCRQQRAYLPSRGEESTDGAAGGDLRERARREARDEEEFMVALVKRLSQLVLRTKELHVLPELLESILPAFGTPGGGAMTVWLNPDLVADFFNDVLPQWSNAWKELMELQLALLRSEEKLKMAVALGRAFAIVLSYLKREQMARNSVERMKPALAAPQGTTSPEDGAQIHEVASRLNGSGGDTNSGRLLSKGKQQAVKDLFISKVPITIEEILRGQGKGKGGSPGGGSRVEFALVLAQVCTPLAGTDEAWAVLERFFRALFASERNDTSLTVSPLALLHSLHVYLSMLRLFPKRLDTSQLPIVHGTGAAAAAVNHSTASSSIWADESLAANTSDQTSGNAVFDRLVGFAPHVLQAVIQQLNQQQQQQQQQLPHPIRRKDMSSRQGPNGIPTAHTASATTAGVLAQLLLGATEVVEHLVHYPLRSPNSTTGSSPASKTEGRTRQAIQETVMLVPRLLFSLRPLPPQSLAAPAATSSSLKRQRERTSDNSSSSDGSSSSSNSSNSESSDEDEAGNRSGAADDSGTADPTLFADYPALVDTVVHRFLHSIWFVASTGHPLLQARPNTPQGMQKSGSETAPVLRDALRTALQPPLFGLTIGTEPNPQRRVAGVLSRCSPGTVALAQESLFYLGVRDAAKLTVVNSAGESHPQTPGDGHRTYSLDGILQMLP